MKTLFTLALLYSLGLEAQVRGSGGGGIKKDEPPTIESADEGGSAPSEISKIIRGYTAHLVDREAKCRGIGERYLKIDPDLLQVYYKLTLVQSNFVPDEKCGDAHVYLACLQDDEAKKKLEAIVKDKRTFAYMKETYKLEKNAAKKILEYFEKLGQKPDVDL